MKNFKLLLVLALGVFTMVSCKSNTTESTTETTTTTVDSTTVIVPTEEATAPVDSPAVESMQTEQPADSTKM